MTITTKTYSISYQKINDLSRLGKTLPLQRFNQSEYFKSTKDLFWRISNLEDKYKALMKKITDSKIKADELVGIKKRRGFATFNEKLKEGKTGFSSISYSSDRKTIYFGSKKIETVLQDYVTRYSELLETLKYLIADIYNDLLGKRDSFNGYIARKTTKSKNDFDFSYLTDFNKYLWNKQKHQSDISVTPVIYKLDTIIMPKLRAEGRFKKVDLETFIEESLDNLIGLMRFIHNQCQENSQNKS